MINDIKILIKCNELSIEIKCIYFCDTLSVPIKLYINVVL